MRWLLPLLLFAVPLQAADTFPAMKFNEVKEVAPGVYVEFDRAGPPIGIEITSVRLRQAATAPATAKDAAE